MYKIYVRGFSLNRVAEISDYQILEFIQRFNSVGSWVLKLPADSKAAKELMKPKSGIVITKDGETIFSGPTTNRNRKWDVDGDVLTIAGKDDLVYLARNLAYPCDPPFTLKDYDVRTGPAETVMKNYVMYNIGHSAHPQRAFALDVEVDSGLGKTVTGRARFHPLIELLSSLALAGGDLGFRLSLINKEFIFQVYQPTDKTKQAIFSPLLGNLASYDYSQDDPETNAVIIGGGGQGKDRILLERGEWASLTEYGRIESFIDRRDTEDIDELIQTMDEELATKAEKTSLSISPIDTPSLSFGKDYKLGDKVSVVITQPNEVVDLETLYFFISAYQSVPVQVERVRKIQEKLTVIQDVVREVKISLTPEGEKITPVVGTPESTSNSILGIFNGMKKLNKRLNFLERR